MTAINESETTPSNIAIEVDGLTHQYPNGKLTMTVPHWQLYQGERVFLYGPSGSGKTTQVPQFCLEQACEMGIPCNIVVAQPRRISAMSVAERVAAERGERVGGTVGYTIRLESKTSRDTRYVRR